MQRIDPVVRVTASLLAVAALVAACAQSPRSPPPLEPLESTTPKPIEPGLVHFTSAGDFSSSADAHAVLAEIASTRPNLHFALGDLSYGRRGDERAWCDLVAASVGAAFPFELLAGNHESNGENGHIDDFARCLPNRLPGLVGEYGREYYVDVPQDEPLVRFIMISPGLPYEDGEWKYDRGTQRYEWTQAAIEGARASGVPWVVVGMHKPCLSIGRYACDPGEDILNLLVRERVDLVLTGHEHLYQRTHQMAMTSGCRSLSSTRSDRDCIADDDDRAEKGAGTVLVTVGTGGNALRDVLPTDAKAPYFAAWSGLNAAPTFGFLDVSVSQTRLSGRFIGVEAGDFFDEFTIESRTGG